MTDISKLLFLPLFASLTWIVIISVGTHLRLIKFTDPYKDVPSAIGCYIVSYAFFFYAFLLNERIFSALHWDYFDLLVYWDLGAAALLLLIAHFFPETGGSSGGFISFTLRDAVFFPAIAVHCFLQHFGIIRKSEEP